LASPSEYCRVALAPVSVRCSPLALPTRFRVFALPRPPDRFGPRFKLSWSWLPFEVCPTIDRPVCQADPPRPVKARRRPSCVWRPLRPGLTLLRFLLPSAQHFPGAPIGSGVTSPTGSAFRFSRPLDGFRCPGPSRPCFMPLTLLGFALQSFPLPGIRTPLGAVAPLRLGASPFAPAIVPRVPSRSVTYGRVGAGPPREGPLRLAFPRRRFPAGLPAR
jgi:hypothetical protein